MIISNANGESHAGAIKSIIDGADEIVIAVAFLKRGGADHLAPMLEERLAVGATVELFVGTDFFLTEPAALKRLLEVKKRYSSCSVMIADRAPATFHPKVYCSRRGENWRSLVGSANLTKGALQSNEEISLVIDHANDDAVTTALNKTFDRYRAWKRFQTLDPLLLQQYTSQHGIDKRERERYEKARDKALPDGFDLRVILDWHQRYLADPATSTAQADRRRKRTQALRVQQSIAALASHTVDAAARKVAKDGLGDLMGSAGGRHLWGSGSIHRQGSKALEHPAKVIRLFALARDASQRPPREGYAEIRRAAESIPGVGLNMATEILCTFAPTQYAVYNGNTVGALGALGIASPQYAQFHAIGPGSYERLCETIQALAGRIGAADLSEADAFLNWIYWKRKAENNA
ncbi:phospholipase D-like domain-containing protein [Novosphingobium sp.]|uniref:phospholipase D-like domain-containing protein n=1 Tax=Novosphingobium sp. TaxID=1874826 RepID=UPI00286E127E|nr:phospholipase D-like domain-containing protein [Novosphingobium sp.]